MPSAFAVRRLMPSCKRSMDSIGISPGGVPCTILSTLCAMRRMPSATMADCHRVGRTEPAGQARYCPEHVIPRLDGPRDQRGMLIDSTSRSCLPGPCECFAVRVSTIFRNIPLSGFHQVTVSVPKLLEVRILNTSAVPARTVIVSYASTSPLISSGTVRLAACSVS